HGPVGVDDVENEADYDSQDEFEKGCHYVDLRPECVIINHTNVGFDVLRLRRVINGQNLGRDVLWWGRFRLRRLVDGRDTRLPGVEQILFPVFPAPRTKAGVVELDNNTVPPSFPSTSLHENTAQLSPARNPTRRRPHLPSLPRAPALSRAQPDLASRASSTMSTAPPAASPPARTPPSAEMELLQAKPRIAELEKEKLELELKVAKRVAVSDDDDDVDNLFTGNLEKTNTTVVERLVLSVSETEDESYPTVGDALVEPLAFVLLDGPLNTVLS
ncbi:MAG: hypothetical protein BJ554DRAFT_5656, partial [Olpidium bornovanus]